MLSYILCFLGGAATLLVGGTIYFFISFYNDVTGTKRWNKLMREEKKQKKLEERNKRRGLHG